MISPEPSSDFVQFWNDILLDKFERFRDVLQRGLSKHSEPLMRELSLPTGARVVDVGCGWGDTAIEIARRVGPGGSVLGLDCVDGFLDAGRRDAETEGIDNVRFECADVEIYEFQSRFDLAFSRFGMMFFANPVAAMRRIRSALEPGSRLVFMTWRAIEDNPWVGIAKQVVSRFLPPPGEDALTCGPGPFSMASESVVTAQLEAAGFDDIGFQRIDTPVWIGDTPELAIEFQLALGPAGEIVREAGQLAIDRRDELNAALWAEISDFLTDDGVVIGSSSWAITARNPG